MAGPAHKTRKAMRTVSVQAIALRQYVGDQPRDVGFGHRTIPYERRDNIGTTNRQASRDND